MRALNRIKKVITKQIIRTIQKRSKDKIMARKSRMRIKMTMNTIMKRNIYPGVNKKIYLKIKTSTMGKIYRL